MAEQTSRLAIILDSTKAKQNSDTLASSLERLTTQGEKATGSTDELGFSFKRLATSAAGALSIGIVIKTVDEWGQVAARMKNALRSVEGDIKNYSAIQERFLTISNRNGKDIADTQLLYIGAASSMQELGYSTTQTVDYIESLSSAMTANASSVNEVLSMQNALNKAMVAGKVAGENWNSIMNATPTLLGDIAKQLEKQNGGIKVTEMEVKKLAADGKISFKLFADAVMAAKDANNALADSMDNTVADGLTRVTNSAKAYYGELNQSLGITRSMSAGLAGLSDNFGAVSTVLTSVVGIGAARYLGELSNKTLDSAKSAVRAATENKKLAVEKVATTKATIAQIQSEKSLVMTSQQSLNAQLAATKAESQRASLRKQLSANSAELTALTKAETAATNELAAAQARLNGASRALSGAVNVLKSGLALVGGPIGFAMLAGAGLYYYWQQAEQAREKTREFTNEIPDLISNLKKLNKVELDATSVKLIKNINQLKEDLSSADEGIEKLKGTYARAQKVVDSGKGLSWDRQEAIDAAKKASDDLKLAYAERQAIVTKLSLAEEAEGKVNQQLASTIIDQMQAARQQSDALESVEPKVKMLADAQSFLAQKLGISTNAMRQFNAQSLLLNYGGEDASKLIEGMKQQVELSKVAGKARAQLAAEQTARRAGANADGIKEARELAGIEYDNLEKQKELNKTTTYSESAAQKRLSSLQEQNAALKFQSEISDKLGTQQQALVKWNQEIKGIEDKQAKGKLTADQKSLLANKALITAELERGAAYEKIIQRKEAEVKIAAYNKQLMEETAQAQKAYNMELQGAGMGNLARSRMQEKLRVEDEFQKKQAALTAQYNDASSGITKEMYAKETQTIKNELDKRILMMQGYHAEQDTLRENWQMGMKESLLNYIDEATNYNQIAADAVTNILNTTTSAISAGFADMINGTKSVGDAFRDMATGMGQAVIQQLTQMAAQWLVYQAVQLLVSKTTQSSETTAIGANAQAASQMAGLNAYASTAAIPLIGPALAPTAMATALAATQPIAMSIMATSAAGMAGFATGGYTGNGSKYDPRGIVHAGEFVFTKEATSRIGVENLNRMMSEGEIPQNALKSDQIAMKYINPANSTSGGLNKVTITNTFIIGGKEQTESSTHDATSGANAIKNEIIQIVSEQLDKALRQSGKISNFVTAKIGR
ncbi:tape measure protein [Moellerella wisconsensis]|uniref:tape measure protein n=1 Tax=Moellerella wisconsensis TaxID=158849 RepID=UPI001F4DFAB2|nr:tape measure protein [Moellerella wisconsensis]UNH25096.1 tape measure protein [Moellerella wisconsensis]